MFAETHRSIQGFDFNRAKGGLGTKGGLSRLKGLIYSTLPFGKKIRQMLLRFDVRNISPVGVYELSGYLHEWGLISNMEYLYLSFQPEMHPNFNATIGIHTGQEAEPEKRRDYVEIWAQRYTREQRSGSMKARKSRQILRLLQHLEILREITMRRTAVEAESEADMAEVG